MSTPEGEIIARVDRWFGGALCIAYKSHHEGRPNEPMTYLYRSDLLAGLGVDEETEARPAAAREEEAEFGASVQSDADLHEAQTALVALANEFERRSIPFIPECEAPTAKARRNLAQFDRLMARGMEAAKAALRAARRPPPEQTP